jgi:hypothetical protein
MDLVLHDRIWSMISTAEHSDTAVIDNASSDYRPISSGNVFLWQAKPSAINVTSVLGTESFNAISVRDDATSDDWTTIGDLRARFRQLGRGAINVSSRLCLWGFRSLKHCLDRPYTS